MRQAVGLVWVAVMAMVVGGCASARARLENPMALPGVNAETTEQVARRVLRELRFEVEHPVASKGYLVTGPVTGASWFEFWRADTIGVGQHTEASFHTTRRRAAVAVTPTEEGSEVFVKVVKERFCAPGVGPRSVGETYNLFRPEKVSLWSSDELMVGEHAWTEKGRDPLLEQRILRRIYRVIRPVAAGP